MNLHTDDDQVGVYADDVAPGDITKSLLGVALETVDGELFAVFKVGGIVGRTGPFTETSTGPTELRTAEPLTINGVTFPPAP